jgi:hypothetical protein
MFGGVQMQTSELRMRGGSVPMIPDKNDFTPTEWAIIESRRTPAQVQRFLSTLPYNHERGGGTCRSFRGSLTNQHIVLKLP